MSSTPPPAERDALAAEYALRILEGDELLEAQRRERSDPAFAG
jgi:anti-sigma-K factor RskA